MTPQNFPRAFAAFALLASNAFCALAAVPPVYTEGTVTFDGLSASQHVADVAPAYQGFTWGAGFVTWADLPNPNLYTTFQANAGTSIARADHSSFYFDSADFFLRPGAGTNDIYIFLYDQSGALVYDGFNEEHGRNHIVDTDRSQTFGAITNIDKNGVATYYSGQVARVAFNWDGTGDRRSGNANDFGMDNFHYRATALVSAVPEPESYAMLLTGLGLIGAIRRRKPGVQTSAR